MPIDIELLEAGDNDEWQRAWDELHLLAVAKNEVWRYLGRRFPQFVESEAAKALEILCRMKKLYCENERAFIGLLKKIAQRVAFRFLRRRWTEVEVHEERPDDAVADVPRLHGFELDWLVEYVVEETNMSAQEEKIFRELSLGDLTLLEFASRCHRPIGTVGRQKAELSQKLQEFLEDDGPFLRGELGPRLRSPTFSVRDLINLPSLANKFRRPIDAVSTYLVEQFSDATRAVLANYEGPNSPPVALQEALVQTLNGVIRRSIYNPRRFGGVALRSGTRRLLLRNPQGLSLPRLNRLLLEDAYPLELARKDLL